MIVDLDGRLVRASEARVSAFDGAYQYGDALFETLRCYAGYAHRLEDHLTRLRREADLLQLEVDTEPAAWRSRLRSLLAANGWTRVDARVRIQVSRGGGPDDDLFDLSERSPEPVVFVRAAPIGPELERRQRDGVSLMSMSAAFARGNFPQVKSSNYLPSIMAHRIARAGGHDDALLLGPQQRVLESASGNVFAVRGRMLMTPSTRMGILPGITRNAVIELARAVGLEVREVLGELRDLLVAEEVFITSSVQEILPVVRIDRAEISTGLPGPWTQRLQQAYRAEVETGRDREPVH